MTLRSFSHFVFFCLAGVQERNAVVRPAVASEQERARPDRVARVAEDGAGPCGVPDVRRRGRGVGAPEVREAPDEAPAGPVPEQDALAAPPDQGHVGDRPGAHRQGGHVRRRHRFVRDTVQSGRRAGDGRAQQAAHGTATHPSGFRKHCEYTVLLSTVCVQGDGGGNDRVFLLPNGDRSL